MTSRVTGCLIVLAVCIFSVSASAEEVKRGFIRLQGVTVFCPTCQRLDEEDCELTVKGEPRMVSCERLLDYLLPELIENKTQYRPEAKELAAYLLSGGQEGPGTRAAILLLLSTEDGRLLFQRQAAQFCGKFKQVIDEAGAANLCQPGVAANREGERAIPAAENDVSPQTVVLHSASAPHRVPESRTILPGAVSFCVVLGFIGFFYAARRSSGKTSDEQGLTAEERAELRELRAYFELPFAATASQLKKSYRMKVRSVHPDLHQGREEEFHRLRANYERTLALIERLGSNCFSRQGKAGSR